MKLRGKKTGEIIELKLVQVHDKYLVDREVNFLNGEKLTLKLLVDNFDDVEEEPLIKDEKVRKAVRAWADANKIDRCKCNDEIHCITFETERGMFISFDNADTIPPEGNYTIVELCGDVEE